MESEKISDDIKVAVEDELKKDAAAPPASQPWYNYKRYMGWIVGITIALFVIAVALGR